MRNSIVVAASDEEVFDVLDDPDAYPEWVVGTRRIRSVDRRWPFVGSRLHHAVGVPGAEIKDSSVVVRRDPPHFLELDARFRPGGIARVQLRVQQLGHGRTRVTIAETLTGGPLHRLPGIITEPAIGLRNAWSLRRLRRLVEQRAGRVREPEA
jgi:uncharacterized protein YndB with AHSA1/START domain